MTCFHYIIYLVRGKKMLHFFRIYISMLFTSEISILGHETIKQVKCLEGCKDRTYLSTHIMDTIPMKKFVVLLLSNVLYHTLQQHHLIMKKKPRGDMCIIFQRNEMSFHQNGKKSVDVS